MARIRGMEGMVVRSMGVMERGMGMELMVTMGGTVEGMVVEEAMVRDYFTTGVEERVGHQVEERRRCREGMEEGVVVRED